MAQYFDAIYPKVTQGTGDPFLRQSGTIIRAVPTVLFSTPGAVAAAPSGTMGANGAVYFGSNVLPRVYSRGIWLWFPAGAVYSGSSAGAFWVEMVSNNSGTVYNPRINSGHDNTPWAPPANKTAITDAGPGAFTGVSGVDAVVNMIRCVTPSGVLGKTGVRRATITTNNLRVNEGTDKFVFANVGPLTGPYAYVAAKNGPHRQTVYVYNENDSGKQKTTADYHAIPGMGTAIADGVDVYVPAVPSNIASNTTPIQDTNSTTSYRVYANKSAATSVMVIESVLLEVIPSFQ